MNINEIAKEIHQVNVDKGFWEQKEERNIGELLMLCVSELSEALEAHRSGGSLNIAEEVKAEYQNKKGTPDYSPWFRENVKNTFPDELADTMIRIMDLSAAYNIDLEWYIRAKLEYNKTRAHRHGKAY